MKNIIQKFITIWPAILGIFSICAAFILSLFLMYKIASLANVEQTPEQRKAIQEQRIFSVRMNCYDIQSKNGRSIDECNNIK